ncbi:LytR family transcriptional regulator [Streptomyces sp. ICN441]|uniref:LytR family transcriptional regulator n=1 Tax=Streptomyces tirandamycinicus TaxID=2174846 RepID=A0A2S1SRS8_9ACTN|nr:MULTISPECIES: LCP family protein [Streptomyces]AWI29124.1 LytR family transcriptional regulator [Streptomyces tirandamycinicus]TFE48313.1 LytR family transcriptional regulator [Streptomyces sp. ICN441]
MDAQSRGQADDIDPADQWVLNPQTGNYELRLDRSAPQPASPRSAGASRRAAGRRGTSGTPTTADVPGQRTRRPGRGGNPRGGDGGGRGTQQTAAGRRKRKQQKSRKKSAAVWTGGVMACVLVAGSAFAYYLYERLNGNLNTVDVGDAGSKGFSKDGPVNILILGTDKRTGAGNEGYGDKGSSGHADTTFLFHVSEDRTNATALSIPRDLITDIPDCPTKQPDGSTKIIKGSQGVRFNESFGVGGRDPGCTMRTVKQMTGVPVDHFMMADFNAVKTLSTAVGGVEVCLVKPIKDRESKLDLPAGKQRVAGEDALAFVRNRHGLGNESDLDRIKQQQQFVASMIRQMKEDTLGNPKKMFAVAEAATQALTVDSAIGDIPKLTAMAQELGKIDIKHISFATVPVVDNTDGATVLLDEVKAPQVFSMIQNDVSFTEVKKKESAAKDKQAALLEGARADASEVRVDVYNGSDTPGAAQKTLNWLQVEKGVLKSTNKSNAPEKTDKTTLQYAPDQADQARKLADLMGLPATALKPGTQDAGGAGDTAAMVLTLGADFKGAGVPVTAPAKPPVDKVEADKQVCAQ